MEPLDFSCTVQNNRIVRSPIESAIRTVFYQQLWLFPAGPTGANIAGTPDSQIRQEVGKIGREERSGRTVGKNGSNGHAIKVLILNAFGQARLLDCSV
jgi:hypothetical protein